MNTNRIFISYSHSSENDPNTPRWKAELAECLKVFTSHNLIDAWDDEQIPGGAKWFEEIKKAIHEARVAILLLTKEALKSEFILEHEFKPLRDRDPNGLLVFPIHCEDCAWTAHSWLADLQIRPFEAKPLAACSDAERAALWRRLAAEIAEELGRVALADLPKSDDPIPDDRIYLDKFPLTRGPALREEKLIGREQELALLDLTFASSFGVPPSGGTESRVNAGLRTAIVTLVAWGGVGKTMLVQHWLQHLQREGWFGSVRVYAWSFYSQGTKEDRQASEDTFLAHALGWFGVQCEPTLSPWDKGRLLAVAVARERTLLILDGIEPLQYPPGPMGGQLRAPGVQSLLKQLACKASALNSQPSTLNQALCLVTTREPLTDLANFQRREGSPWGSVLRVDLGNLTEEAGAALLHHTGANRAGAAEIKPDDKELLAASREVDGHALTLNLLGRFLARAHGGDIRRRDLVKFEKTEKPYEHAFKMLTAFENWFARSGEFGARQLAVLRMLGLFDRPADAGCIGALRKPPVIAGLTDPLFITRLDAIANQATVQPLLEEDWNTATSFLAEFSLVAIQADPNNRESMLDCHPLIREYFGSQALRKDSSRNAAHKRIYDHLCASTNERESPWRESLQPLFQAVAHGCKAGLHQDVYQLYISRIQRGEMNFSLLFLPFAGDELTALSHFFEKPWSAVSNSLTEEAQLWLLAAASFCLRALGRVDEAAHPISIATERSVTGKDWKRASIGFQNLYEIQSTLGHVAAAVESAEGSVGCASQIDDWVEQRNAWALFGAATHLVERSHDAYCAFMMAESLQSQRFPGSVIYGLEGFRYSDLLLAIPERTAWGVMLNREEPLDKRDVGISSSKEVARATLIEHVADTSQRVEQMLALDARVGRHFDVALGTLAIIRTGICAWILGPFAPAPPSISTNLEMAATIANDGNMRDYLPLFFMTRAWLQFLQRDRLSARADLDEAWDIAERGPMRLHMADIHLHRARLFFREKAYPWKSPQDDLAAAEKLINDCGYHRRDEELADAKRAILGST